MKYIEELREQSTEELNAALQDLYAEHYEALCSLRISQDKVRPDQLKKQKKNIARIKTVLRQRELEG